jgi:hypothetical protein
VKGSIVTADESGNQDQSLRILVSLLLFLHIGYEGYVLKELFLENGFVKSCIIHVWSLETLIDLILTRSSLFYLALYFSNYFLLTELNANELRQTSTLNLAMSVNVEKWLQHACALMMLFSFFKTLNLLKLNPKTYLITGALTTGFVELLVVISFLLLNYAVFGMFGHVIFNENEQFATIETSVYSSLISIVGHIELDELAESRCFTWLFVWQVLMFLYMQQILLNLVVSVIIGYFDQAVASHKRSRTERTFNRVLRSAFHHFSLFSKIKSDD